jgi:hypothetical protein
VDEDPEGHEFALGFVSVDCELSGECVLIDVRFFDLHLSKIYQINTNYLIMLIFNL